MNGRQAAVYRPGKGLFQTRKPFAGDHVLEFRSSRRWYRFGRLRKYIEQAGDPAWAAAVFAEATRLFAEWRWGAPDDARVTAALVACTVVQHCLHWRPQIGLTGATNSGKSTLLETLNLLFGALALHTEKATEAGLRQAVGNRSCAIVIDEFEADGQRVQVLKLLRTSARGANIVRGTSDQKGKQFGLKHIAWVAAIELGLKNDTDRNRFIILETLRPDDDKFGTMNLPTDDAIAELGQKLAAIGIRHVLAADPLAVKLKTTRVPGVPTRVIESFAVPAAMVATACGQDEEAARKILREMLAGRNFTGRAQSDHDGLLRAIMNSLVAVRAGVQHPVSQILTNPLVFADAHPTLIKMGVAGASEKPGRRPTTPEGCTHLFIDPDTACRHLLKGTPWADKDVKELLLRIEHVGDDGNVQKAAWQQRRLNGARPWGVLIPRGAAGIEPAGAGDEPDEKLPDTDDLDSVLPLPANAAVTADEPDAVGPADAREPGKSVMDQLDEPERVGSGLSWGRLAGQDDPKPIRSARNPVNLALSCVLSYCFVCLEERDNRANRAGVVGDGGVTQTTLPTPSHSLRDHPWDNKTFRQFRLNLHGERACVDFDWLTATRRLQSSSQFGRTAPDPLAAPAAGRGVRGPRAASRRGRSRGPWRAGRAVAARPLRPGHLGPQGPPAGAG